MKTVVKKMVHAYLVKQISVLSDNGKFIKIVIVYGFKTQLIWQISVKRYSEKLLILDTIL